MSNKEKDPGLVPQKFKVTVTVQNLQPKEGDSVEPLIEEHTFALPWRVFEFLDMYHFVIALDNHYGKK